MLNKFVANVVSIMPERVVWIFSKRYIAGKTLEAAVAVTKVLNSQKVSVTIDVLGEYIHKTDEALEYKKGYLKTIDAVKTEKLQATLSLKPSMFGLLLDYEFCFNQVRDVIKYAADAGISICLDMEDSSCTDIELTLFEQLYTEFPSTVSFVLQAYLHRTPNDLERLNTISKPEYSINVRICKGIYIEPNEIAFQKKEEISKNYQGCLSYMADHNFYCSIATHDTQLVNFALDLIKERKLPQNRYEFQMLYGVRPELRKKLVEGGNRMRVYVPYGTHWFGYSTRRLKENPRIVSHIIKALLFRG
jgi:proline dehydrogenase